MACNADIYYRFFTKNNELKKYFFKVHPATKEKYLKGELDADLVDLLIHILDENPLKRP